MNFISNIISRFLRVNDDESTNNNIDTCTTNDITTDVIIDILKRLNKNIKDDTFPYQRYSSDKHILAEFLNVDSNMIDVSVLEHISIQFPIPYSDWTPEFTKKYLLKNLAL